MHTDCAPSPSQANTTAHKLPRRPECPACRQHFSNFKLRRKIAAVKCESRLLSSEIESVKDQFRLLLANFHFILELAADNINRETAVRIEKILACKNRTILKQKEKIQKLEETQNAMASEKEEITKNIRAHLDEALLRVEELKAENKLLKRSQQPDGNQNIPDSKPSENPRFDDKSIFSETADSSEKKIEPAIEEDDQKNERKCRVKKRVTADVVKISTIGNAIRQEAERKENIKSLGDLKMKIQRLKAELSSGCALR